MALTVATQKVVADVGSEELKAVRLQLNEVIDFLSALMDAVTDGDGDQTASDVYDLEATLTKIVASKELPAAPAQHNPSPTT